MTRKVGLWLASLVAAAATIGAAIASGTDAGYLLTAPGLILAWPFWPEGIHTRPGPASAVSFYLFYCLANLLVWTLAFRFILGVFMRGRGEQGAE